jgi:hypothetical protein
MNPNENQPTPPQQPYQPSQEANPPQPNLQSSAPSWQPPAANPEPGAMPQPGVTPPTPDQPAVLPVQPEAQPVPPASPLPPAAPTFPQPQPGYTPPPKSRKGLIIGLIAGGVGLLVLLVGGFFLLMSLLSVSKADYKAASGQLENVRTAYNKMDSVYLSATASTKTELQNGIDTIKDARTEFDAAYKKLSEEKAIKNDGDIKKLFAAADKKKPQFDAAKDMVLEAYEKIALPTANLEVSDISDLAAMRDAYAAISGLQNASNKKYVDTVTGILQKMVPLAQKIQAGRADYRKYDAKASDQYYDLIADLSTAGRDWQSDIDKASKDGALSDELNALSTPLFDKSLGK